MNEFQVYFNTNNESHTPVDSMTDRELDLIILKMGAFLSILQNKKINQARLLITTVKDFIFQRCFIKLADMDNLQQLVYNIIRKYPALCKSKVITCALINKHGTNKHRTQSV